MKKRGNLKQNILKKIEWNGEKERIEKEKYHEGKNTKLVAIFHVIVALKGIRRKCMNSTRVGYFCPLFVWLREVNNKVINNIQKE